MSDATLSTDLVARLRFLAAGQDDPHSVAITEAADRIEELERLDREAANYVESVICLRTHFTGHPPYMGWKGLGLALTERLDELESARSLAEDANTVGRHQASTLIDAGSNPAGRANPYPFAPGGWKTMPKPGDLCAHCGKPWQPGLYGSEGVWHECHT